MKIGVKKTKMMRISWQHNRKVKITIDRQTLTSGPF